MIKYSISLILLLCSLFPLSKKEILIKDPGFSDESSVALVEQQLGKSYEDKTPNIHLKNVSVEAGRLLVNEGYGLKANGDKTSKQSKHFVCTSCHNIAKEDPDLTKANPEARLIFTAEKGIPFLQATSLYGVINRDSFYNGDYYLKYGDLVNPARGNIREAIKLCATQCAQGRPLKDWEIESILAYFWTLDLKIGDLNLSEDEKSVLENGLINNSADIEALALLNGSYLKASPATFVKPPEDRKRGFGLPGNIEHGRLIYKNSCLHCHYNARYSFLALDESGLSRSYLNKHIDTYHRQSIYQVVRWGVPVKSGKPSYMPQYTLEKMSNQQLEDLKAYISQ